MAGFKTVDSVVQLLGVLPLSEAMPRLSPSGPKPELAALAEAAQKEVPPAAAAAIWLYVDDLERSHAISQGIRGPVGAYWHGIMHRREGDFWNAKYWLRQATEIDLGIPGFDASRFVDQVEAAGGTNPEDLLELQRREWTALFHYCDAHEGE